MITNSSFKEYYNSFYGNQYFRELIYVDTDLNEVLDSLKIHKEFVFNFYLHILLLFSYLQFIFF